MVSIDFEFGDEVHAGVLMYRLCGYKFLSFAASFAIMWRAAAILPAQAIEFCNSVGEKER